MASVKPGDRVIVPWGLDDVSGFVVDVFGPPGDPFVRVQVRLPGTGENDEPVEVPVKMDALRLAPPEATGDGTVEVETVGRRGSRLVAVIAVRSPSSAGQIEVTATAEGTRTLERRLGHDVAQEALAQFALHVAARQIEDGHPLMNYTLSDPDLALILRRASVQPI